MKKKKIYSCQHQQNAPNPCATCRAGRGRKYYEEKKAFHCARCGQLITQGCRRNITKKSSEKFAEAWIEDHSNCQPNPEKVRQNEQLEKEVEYQREKWKTTTITTPPAEKDKEIKINKMKVKETKNSKWTIFAIGLVILALISLVYVCVPKQNKK